MTERKLLDDEVAARVTAMRETEDNAGITEGDLVRSALEDILELDAEDHVGYANEHHVSFKRSWRRLQAEARRRLEVLR